MFPDAARAEDLYFFVGATGISPGFERARPERNPFFAAEDFFEEAQLSFVYTVYHRNGLAVQGAENFAIFFRNDPDDFEQILTHEVSE